jgi:hypothetical protein
LLGLNSAAPGRDKMDAVEELVLVIDVKQESSKHQVKDCSLKLPRLFVKTLSKPLH